MIKITHISDMMKVKPENIEEFLSDMRAVYLSAMLIKESLPDDVDMSKILTHVDWTPDGLGNITPMCNGKELFNMRIVKDEVAP